MTPVFMYEFKAYGLYYRAYLIKRGWAVHRVYDKKVYFVNGTENSGLGRIRAALKKQLREETAHEN